MYDFQLIYLAQGLLGGSFGLQWAHSCFPGHLLDWQKADWSRIAFAGMISVCSLCFVIFQQPNPAQNSLACSLGGSKVRLSRSQRSLGAHIWSWVLLDKASHRTSQPQRVKKYTLLFDRRSCKSNCKEYNTEREEL